MGKRPNLLALVLHRSNVFFVCLSFAFIGILFLLRQSSNSSMFPAYATTCNIPSVLTTTLEITPLSTDNVIDCSGQDITIADGGMLVLKSYTTANSSVTDDGGVLLKVGTLTVATGGTITATGQGYTVGVVDGNASAGSSSGLAGGSGGGNAGGGGLGASSGGGSVVGNPGVAIGLKEYPTVLGGAGGSTSDGGMGGQGGGAIHIQATGTVTINGVVNANGENGTASPGNVTAGGGGAGGSIWVEADTITGIGQVIANGGSTDSNASYMGGGGSGGRVALVCVTATDFPVANVSVAFGDGAQDGQPGTLVGPGCKPSEPTVLRIFETGTPQNTVSRELGVGKLTTHRTLTFASNLATDMSVLEVEVREVTVPFANAPNAAQESQTSSLSCDAIPQGNNVPIAAHCGYAVKQNLDVSKQYHWQARIVRNQIASNWVEFGGNSTSSPDFTIAGPATGIVIARGNNQTVSPGQVLPERPTIRVVDSVGFGVPYYAESNGFVWGETLTGGGSISNIMTVADEWGELFVDWQVGTVAGTANNTLSVRKHNIPWSVTFTENVAPGALHSYKFSAPPLIAVNTGTAVDVVAIDAYGNEISGISHNVNLSAVSAYDVNVPGAGTLLPAQITLIDGRATFQLSYSFTESIKVKGVNAANAAVIGYSNAITVANEIGFCPALIISANTTWRAIDAPGGVYDCRGLGEFTINTGATLMLQSYDNGDNNWGNDYGVTILADSMNIQSGAQISADGKGYLVGPGGGNCLGASYGGYGALACSTSKSPYGNVYNPVHLGSGAAYNGTYGGGAIKLVVSGTLTLDGTISANNANVYNDWAGSGSGGSIWVDTDVLTSTGAGGVIRASSITGKGSAGRIAVYYNTVASFPLDTQHLQAFGSMTHADSNRSKHPGNGTVYVEQKGIDVPGEGTLMADNNNNDGSYGAFVPAGVYNFKQIVVKRFGHVYFEGDSSAQRVVLKGNSVLIGDSTKPKIEVGGEIRYIPSVQGTPFEVNGVDLVSMGDIVGADNLIIGNSLTGAVTLYAKTWAHNDTLAWDFDTVNVGAQGYWYMQGYDSGDTVWNNDYGVSVSAVNITVESGGQISAEGRGYISGPGEGQDSCSGASYGGYGGNGCGSARLPYGSIYGSLALGSGAREGLSYGGGAVRLVVSDTLKVDGRINADNRNTWGGWWRSGSGGGIWINTENLESTGGIGLMTANAQRGKGSGGRIAVYYRNNNGFLVDTAHLQAYGAQDGYDSNIPQSGGGPGTVYVEQLGVDAPQQGVILVDNNNFNSREAYVLPGQYQFKSIKTVRQGHLLFSGSGNGDRVILTSSLGMVGDSTKPRVIIEGVLQYSPVVTGTVLEVNGVDVGLKGDVSGISDMIIGNTQAAAVTLYANTWGHNKDVPWNFGNVTVSTQGYWYMQGYDSGDSIWDNDYGVSVSATNVTVHSGGQISAEGRGYISGPGEGQNTCSGASYGGYGGNGCGSARIPYGSIYEPIDLGSGATEGASYGGGSIKLVVSGTLKVDGRINADNRNTWGGWWRSGSGGGVWIDTENLESTGGIGTITANAQRGKGAGGRIALYYRNNIGFVIDALHLQAHGAQDGYDAAVPTTGGGPGTVYIEQKGVDSPKQGTLLVDNRNFNSRDAYVLPGEYQLKAVVTKRYGHVTFGGTSAADFVTITSGAGFEGDATKPRITINGLLRYQPVVPGSVLTVGGVDIGLKGDVEGITDIEIGKLQAAAVTLYANTWAHNKDTPWSFGNVTIGALGYWYMQGYDSGDSLWDNDYGVSVVAANVTVENGGQISAEGRGYLSGPGEGQTTCSGASYGGYGGNGCGSSHTPYGSIFEPIDLGSGALEGPSYGGGAIKLVVSGTLKVDGRINADNRNIIGGWWRSGSGGSIWIDTENLESTSGSGVLSVNAQQGRGSGGRIALYYRNNNGFLVDSSHLQSYGAGGGYDANNPLTGGAPGTVYVERKGVDQSRQGILLIDNNGLNGRDAYVLPGQYDLQRIELKRYGHVVFAGSSEGEEVILRSGAALVGDGSKPRLTIGGVLKYEPLVVNDTLQVNGVDLGLKGDATGVGNVSVGLTQPGAITLYAYTWARNNLTPWIFQSIRVGPQGYLYLQSYDSGDTDWNNDYGVTVISDDIMVDSGGQINADGRGFLRGPGSGENGSGASHGGYAGMGATASYAPYGDLYQPIALGSGGGETGTYGGGAIRLTVTNELRVDGIISSNSATYLGGSWRSGSGGSIFIEAKNLTSTGGIGMIRANNVNGRGSGGRIAIYYEHNSGYIFDKDHIQALGGVAGYNPAVPETAGGPGTVYWEHRGFDRVGGGSILLHNNNQVGRAQDFSAGIYNFHDVMITQNVRFWVRSNQVTGEGVVFDTTGNFVLESGASILGNGTGYSSDAGEGKGEVGVGYSGGGGGAHGGDGGNGQSDGQNPAAAGGLKYGDQLLPLSIGSGGGSSAVGALGGSGGGLFALRANGMFAEDGTRIFGRMDIFGTISMNGAVGKTGSPGGGGGAGGSILLQGNSCSISGNLLAEGGAGGNSDVDGGAGGGGHISILYNQGPCDVTGSVSVAAGIPVDPANYWASYAQVGTYPPIPNSVPVVPQFKEQYEPLSPDVVIPVSGTIGGTTVKFEAGVSDNGASISTPKRLSAQFELKPVGTDFDGATNLYSTEIIMYTGGEPIVIATTIPNLILGSSYHWRVRSVNADNGLVSDWSNFGGNSESVADFTITSVAYLEISVTPNDIELTDYATLTVTAYNQNGIVDPTYKGTIHVSATSNTALLPTEYTFTSSDAGMHVFTDEIKFFEVGAFSITVQDTVNVSLQDTVGITVREPQVPLVSISADDVTVSYQGQTVLRWSSAFVNNLVIDNGIGGVGSSGSITVLPTGTTTYTITGTSIYGDPMEASVTVTVAAPNEPILSFTATLLQIPVGSTTQLQWDGAYVSNLSIDNGIGGVTTSDNRVVSPAQTTTYTLTATSESGVVVTRQVTITVVPLSTPQLSFGASRLTIRPGESVSLFWASSNVTNLTISQGVGPVVATGETGVTLSNTTTYIISGTSSSGHLMQSQITITVVPIVVTPSVTPTVSPTATSVVTGTIVVTPSPSIEVRNPPTCPVIEEFSASAYVIELNRAVTLRWTVVGVQKVKIDTVSGDSPAQGSMSIAPQKSIDITLKVPAALPQCQVSKTIHIEVVESLPWKNTSAVLIGVVLIEVLQGNVWFALLGLLDRAKKKLPWGVLYDAMTKKLLARGTVRLWDAVSGKIVDTVVSNAQGVFHLQPRKGKYILKVSLSGYEYPSKVVTQHVDSGYMNVYHGEVIVVDDEKQPIMVAVPLDPLQGNVSLFEFARRLIQKMVTLLAMVNIVVLWAGFVYSSIVTIMFPVAINIGILAVYCLMIAFWIFDRVRKPKLTGNVTDVQGKPVAGLELGLFDTDFNTLIARTFTTRTGTYSFVVANKDYYLRVIDMKYRLLQQGLSKDGLFLQKNSLKESVRMITSDLVVYR